MKFRGKISNTGITIGKKTNCHIIQRQKLHRVLWKIEFFKGEKRIIKIWISIQKSLPPPTHIHSSSLFSSQIWICFSYLTNNTSICNFIFVSFHFVVIMPRTWALSIMTFFIHEASETPMLMISHKRNVGNHLLQLLVNTKLEQRRNVRFGKI